MQGAVISNQLEIDRPMASFGQNSRHASLRASLQSYIAELRGWVGRISGRYATAAILLLSGTASVIAAIGVGLAALFHWLEANYGSIAAYGIIAGLLIFAGIIAALSGIVLLKNPLPAVPSPRQQMKAAGRSVTARAMLAASAPDKVLIKADPITETMVGLAAACLVGWLISSRLRR